MANRRSRSAPSELVSTFRTGYQWHARLWRAHKTIGRPVWIIARQRADSRPSLGSRRENGVRDRRRRVSPPPGRSVGRQWFVPAQRVGFDEPTGLRVLPLDVRLELFAL